jgi:hypothetical protein
MLNLVVHYTVTTKVDRTKQVINGVWMLLMECIESSCVTWLRNCSRSMFF